VFLQAINWRSAALSRSSPEASNPISSSPRGKNSKLIIEGWCENSPQKRAKDNPPKGFKKSPEINFKVKIGLKPGF
jgi:hypothetical protein